MRFYWITSNSRAKRQFGAAADFRLTSVLNAADVSLFDSPTGITGLITVRQPAAFKFVADTLRVLVRTIDGAGRLEVDKLSESLSEDFFLWLLYRLQGDTQLNANLKLVAVHEMSSRDRQLRGARFQDEATVDRLELAALIAKGTVGFGPAKVGIDANLPDAAFELELHRDGGFQAFRSTVYTNLNLDGAQLGERMMDDLWVSVLPELRKAHADDTTWAATGRTTLRASAKDQVKTDLSL